MGMFDGLLGGQNDNSAISVLKELQDPKNIEMKSDLNIKQIRVLVQVRLYYLLQNPDMTAGQAVDQALEYYLKLLTSVGRKSRTEITDAVKNMRDSLMTDQLALANLGGRK